MILAQVKNIEKQRQLLEEPDLILPLVANLTQLLREALNRLDKEYQSRHNEGMARLKADTNWQQLDPEQRNSLLAEQKLTLADAPEINVASAEKIVATLEKITLSALTDRCGGHAVTIRCGLGRRYGTYGAGSSICENPEPDH